MSPVDHEQDSLSTLEERIQRAVQLVARLRQEKELALEEAAADPREIEAVAASVNELMLSIAGKVGDADTTRIAVMACLHLADKLRALERQNNQLRQGVDPQLVEQLIAAVEEAVI